MASVIELSGFAFERLRVDSRFALFRGRRNGADTSILMLTTGCDQEALADLRRLEHEYALASEFDPSWAVRPLAIERRDGRSMMLFEDPGGDLLEGMLGPPFELTHFLQVAIALAGALHEVHKRGLLHKDIRPANVFVDSSARVRLTGFGIASRLPRERQPLAPPETIEGTFPYMAPEQTGRMNRSIDARGDLYSLGVTLYEMITGKLPFSASDPMEWIHCHIARQPTPPTEWIIGIPGPLEAIMLKLLAKSAEDRYQTALGLEADLRHCRAQWEAHGRIEPFPLGARDVSDRLLIPERLYGRERDIDELLTAFDRVVAGSATELVLISGYSGIGKSSLVNELQKMLLPRRALFASDKFDQYKRDIPYTTLAQAFQSLVRRILGESEAELNPWRHSLTEALGLNGQLMINLIPELAAVIGEQPPIPDLPPQDAQNRFRTVFQRFLGVFVRPGHSLVLFLDDLQWVDTATLELLEALLVDGGMRRLLLVGAYRDNEVGLSHPLMRALRQIRAAGTSVREIVLTPLAFDDVARLAADALHETPDRVQPLAQLVFEKTGGNAFFVIQFITALTEDGLIAFDADAAAWRWDIDRIRAKGATDNVADLMAAKLSVQPATTQKSLGMLACLGSVVEIATLDMVSGRAKEAFHIALWQAVRAGLIYRLDAVYAFIHDRVREAAYALIPESERAAAHLHIARTLFARAGPVQLEEEIFEIANQFNRGAALIRAPEEREQVANLNLMAGKRARTSAAYASAQAYFAAGSRLLPDEGWTRHYRLTFDLELHFGECESLIGDLATAEQRLSALSGRATNLVDRAAITCLRMTLHTTRDRSDRALDVGLEYLRHVGVHWSPHPTEDEMREEYDRIRRRLGDRSIEALIDLPVMSDPEWRATLDVLTLVVPAANFTDENLFCLAVAKMANLSLEHGNSDASCHAYVWLGMILRSHFGDFQAGFRFGRLAIELVEQRRLDRYRSRVYSDFGHLINPWTRHLRVGVEWVRRAVTTAQGKGDLTFASFACNSLAMLLLASGEPLGDVQREAENGLEFTRKVHFGLFVDIMTGQLGLVRALRGLTADLSSFGNDQFDERRFEQHLEANPRLAFATCWYWIRKLQARFHDHDYLGAVAAAERARSLLWNSSPFFEVAEYHFYGALARAAVCASAPVDQLQHHSAMLLAHHDQISICAQNCPETFANREALVDAEIARLNKQPLRAECLYEKAIRSAREHGFIQNEGLANELSANFYAARGFETIAHAYLRNAHDCYLRWGAEGKVRQLERLHPHLRRNLIFASPSAVDAPVEQLDVGAVVKACQAISCEMLLDRLVQTLMTIALEHAGAQRGLLILMKCDAPHIEAEATTEQNSVVVRVRQQVVTSALVPESLLNTVIRVRKSVIIDDASVESQFSRDGYIRENRVRSIMCVPLVKQTQLIGVLYLENNLTSHAFTPGRISLLELLASQAAFSLENARLYSESIVNEERWRKLFERVPIGVVLTDSLQRYIAANPAFQRMTGYSEAELLRLSPIDITHEDDRAASARIIAAHAAREPYELNLEKRYRRKDGGITWAEVSAFQAPFAGSFDLLGGVVVDVTERKRAEEGLRLAQTELAHAARLTTLGELAASIAHEINQPLAGIASNGAAGLNWLNRKKPDLDQARDALSRIVRDSARASDVIRNLRALAKKSGPQLTSLDIDDVIRDVLMLTGGELRRHGVALQIALAAGDRRALGDRVQLQQVLLNLIMNGIDAMSGLAERTRELMISSSLAEPGSVLVAVEDTGIGFDQDTAERIFEPFFTTKSEGLGIGLSICRSIIEGHRGRLWVSPRVPHGVVVRFTIPIELPQ
jgi:PAS domain S-box-containing protein